VRTIIVVFYALHVKIRDEGLVRNKAIYLAPFKNELYPLPDRPVLWQGRPAVISRLVRNPSSTGQSEHRDKVPLEIGAHTDHV
jgi:hypothetical protein